MPSYSIEWTGPLPDDDDTMVDLGGGMVVPLRELVESAEEAVLHTDQIGQTA